MSDGSPVGGIAADPNMPRIGQRVVQRYDIVRLLGQGGFAVVYEAIDTRASGRVAIKILHAEKSMDESFSKRFRQEVMLVRQLQHPNTIKITDAGSTETGCLFMVMEYIAGGELADLMRKTGPMPPERVTHIGMQVLKSLAEAHEKTIVHRDLKPQNVMIGRVGGEDDFVKVLDFGISKALEPDLQQVQTQAGMVFCTPKYAAPEILMARGVKPAADVYAIGLIMSEMLLGESLINASSEAEAIAAQLSPEPLRLPPQVAQTPLGQVIQKALAKSLDDRYKDALEMLQDLRAATQAQVTPGSFASASYSPAGVSGQQPVAQQTLKYDVTGETAAPDVVSQGRGIGFTLFMIFVILAVLGGGGFAVWQFVLNKPADNGTADTGIVETDVVEEVIEEPVDGPWMGAVSEPFAGSRQETASPSAEISQLRMLDQAAQLNQWSLTMLGQALMIQEIPAEFDDESKEDYLQVVANLVTVLNELNLCEAAQRRIDRAFVSASVIAQNAAASITAMRNDVRQCRERVAEGMPEWNQRAYSARSDEAIETYNQAMAIPETAVLERQVRLLESLHAQRESIAMVIDALENDSIRSRYRDEASEQLFILFQYAVFSLLDLDLRLSAEAEIEAMLEHLELLPDTASQQVQELQLQLNEENQRAAAELPLSVPYDAEAPWSWRRYQELLQLADRAWSITRSGPVPTPEEDSE